jgi:hypothetical protein
MQPLLKLAREPREGARKLLARRGLAATKVLRDLCVAQALKVRHADDRTVGLGQPRESTFERGELFAAHGFVAGRGELRFELIQFRKFSRAERER